jgi:hypothetical protein
LKGHAVIHVKENILSENNVLLDVSGVLDSGAVPVLSNVCDRHLDLGRAVVVNLEAVFHITREGRQFIQEIEHRVSINNLPEFMKPAHPSS